MFRAIKRRLAPSRATQLVLTRATAASLPQPLPAEATAFPSPRVLRNVLLVTTGTAAALQMHEDSRAVCASLPRTLLAARWALATGTAYKAVLSQYPDRTTPTFLAALSKVHTARADALLDVCCANGGVYVKAGQFVASFGAVPPEYRSRLQLLQDRAKPRPLEEVRGVVEDAVGADLWAVFSEFSPEATAAASLAQVHRARLRDSGHEVAVKVQYPGLGAAVAADVTVLRLLSAAAEAAFPEYRLGWLVREVAQKLEVELDFRVEVSNAQWLRAALRTHPDTTRGCVAVPSVWTQMSSSRIIVMEWVDGVKVTDLAGLAAAGIDGRCVASDLLRVFGDMVYVHGRVHGDPHAGNILVRPVGSRSWISWVLHGSYQPYQVVLLDHGTYLDLQPSLRELYCRMWSAFVAGDSAAARRAATQLAGPRAGEILPVILTRGAKTREEKQRLRQEAGLGTLADTTQLLAAAPQGLVELLRVSAMVRGVCGALGSTAADRLLLYGAAALRGLGREAGWQYRWWVWGRVQAVLVAASMWGVVARLTRLATWPLKGAPALVAVH